MNEHIGSSACHYIVNKTFGTEKSRNEPEICGFEKRLRYTVSKNNLTFTTVKAQGFPPAFVFHFGDSIFFPRRMCPLNKT